MTFVTGLGSRHQDRIVGSGLGWVAVLLGWCHHPNQAELVGFTLEGPGLGCGMRKSCSEIVCQ